MRDVTKVVAETTADRERQQLSALEPETMAASMTFGSIDHYRMRTRPTQSCFGARNVCAIRQRPLASSTSFELAPCGMRRREAIGGASLMGGKGSISGTLLGAIILGAMRNGLTLLNVQAFYQLLATGLIILFAMLIDRATRGRT
jgi:hypothetical protein